MSAYPSAYILRNSAVVDPSLNGSPVAPDYVPDYCKTAAQEWTGAATASADSGVQYTYPGPATYPCLFNACCNITTYYDAWGDYVEHSPTDNAGGRAKPAGYGPELSFLASHLAAYPSTPLAAVKCSMGGSSLGEWSPANTGVNGSGTDGYLWPILVGMLSQAAARLDATGQPWRWGSFVWYQGESGAHGGQTDDSAYLSGARAFFARVRGLTRSDLPVIVARIGDTWGWEATPNPYLATYGNIYQAIDYSITSGGKTVSAPLRASYLASAVLRRATQVTLGGDAGCAWWSNDGLPPRPPCALTAANNDDTAYHLGGPGVLASGERAFAAYQPIAN